MVIDYCSTMRLFTFVLNVSIILPISRSFALLQLIESTARSLDLSFPLLLRKYVFNSLRQEKFLSHDAELTAKGTIISVANLAVFPLDLTGFATI